MSASRLVAVVFIYICATVGWFTLGASVVHRTGESDEKLKAEVARLWGGQHVQLAPDAYVLRSRQVTREVQDKDAKGQTTTRRVVETEHYREPVPLEQSRITADIGVDHRRKGLLWYDTYAVAFEGRYRLRVPANAGDAPCFVHFAFPSTQAIYDGFKLKVDGVEMPAGSDLSDGISRQVAAAPGTEATVEVAYRSRGLGDWTYGFAKAGVAQVRDFTLDMRTDFSDIDFPAGTLSPTARSADGTGTRLQWKFDSLVTGQRLGMDPPDKLNPGPVAARITFFAPVGLLFFITVMVMLGLLRGRSLHPMNYFFLAAAFFAFHLLLAYLVDHVNVHTAFVIAAATSIVLVVSYLRLVGGMRFALLEAGTAQLVFLVLFSYAFFFEGYTGLTVTVGAVLTLFVLMQLTGRLDWNQVLVGRGTPPTRDAAAAAVI